MKLTVVGCSGSYPGPDSAASSYLLEHEHEGRMWRLLIDLGNGALGQLHRYVDPVHIDAVALSHLHADHCLDLCGFYVLRKYHPTGAQPRIPVWGPPDTARRMAKAYDLDEDPGMNEEFDFRTYPVEPVHVGPFTIEAIPVAHPVPAYGLRVSAGGAVLAYSGDTGICDGLLEVARDADVFLCEASFIHGDPNPPDLHLTGVEAGEVATRADARTLVVTHIPPWHDADVIMAEARGAYPGTLHQATAGLTIDLTR
ncbi:MAG: MBL fold metallo-hydrolase [Myxococcales bacterium]|nr:MAG: MBL fold metallo-hydrolase [Myxococcales bacterium]